MIPFITVPPISFFGLEFHMFGILVAIGFYSGTQLSLYRARHLGLKEDVVADMSLITIIFGIIGAHLFHVFFYEPELLRDPINLLKFWSGLSSYGGILCATTVFILFLRYKKQPILPYVDLLGLGGCVGFFFGRMGCALAHDHPGKLSDFFLAVQYPGGARHDLGFYEMFLWLFILLFMLYQTNGAKKKPSFWGKDFLTILTLYAPGRFFLEFLRATDRASNFVPDARYFGLTPAHYVSLSLFILCLGLWSYQYKLQKLRH